MKLDERRCLEDLVAGRDTWWQFWQLFGFYIVAEVSKFSYNDQSLIDDIYQDLCVKLIRKDYRVIRRFLANPFRKSFAALLRTIIKRMMIDRYNKHKRRRTVNLDDFEVSSDQSPESTWSNDPSKQHKRETGIVDILLEVSGKDRKSTTFQILYLRFVEGQRVNVIAKRFGMKPNNVGQRIQYHVSKIKDKYQLDLMESIDEG